MPTASEAFNQPPVQAVQSRHCCVQLLLASVTNNWITLPEDAIWEQDDHGHEKDGDNASGGEHGGDPKEHDEVDPAHDSEPQRLKEQRMTPQVKRRANPSTSRLNLVKKV